MPNFGELKKQMRRTVHAALSVPALYRENSSDTPVDLTVRYHTKRVLNGDLTYANYAEIIEGIDRIIFNLTEVEKVRLTTAGQQIAENGIVQIPIFQNVQFTLRTLENPDVGDEMIWDVTRVI